VTTNYDENDNEGQVVWEATDDGVSGSVTIDNSATSGLAHQNHGNSNTTAVPPSSIPSPVSVASSSSSSMESVAISNALTSSSSSSSGRCS
jgi:hypothetical protein